MTRSLGPRAAAPRAAATAALFLSLLLVPSPLVAAAADATTATTAATPGDKSKDKDKPKDAAKDASEDKLSVTTHEITVGGSKLAYTATAGTLVLKEEEGKPRASFFFVAYAKDGVKDPAERPVTFAFNGGPGSSAVWLHLGAFGPRRIELVPPGVAPPPPYRLVDNEHTLLDLTDLVFIDPVTTGYSRPAPGQTPSQFHGVREDIESVAEFIRLWTTRNKRWASPKFLAGESYGTTRAAGLAGHLQDRFGMFLNGVVLVSVVLNFQTLGEAPGNDLPHELWLPSFAAVAWYHQRLPAHLQQLELPKLLERAEAFAQGPYAQALARGVRLPPEARREVLNELASFTGLPPEYLDLAALRVPQARFCKELLRRDRRVVGRFDGRVKGLDRDGTGAWAGYDPSYESVVGAYTAMMNHYARGELGFESDLPYEILTGRVHPWNFGDWKNRYLDVADTLADAMTQNPTLKVFVASGRYDLATPYFATDYTFAHLDVDPSVQANVTARYYEGGHMMYHNVAALAALKADLTAFYGQALPPRK